MANAKYTSKGLPVVSEVTLTAYTKDGGTVEDKEHKQNIVDVHERVSRENPALKGHLDKMVIVAGESIGNFAIARALIYTGATETYALLEAQAEVNKLEQMLKEE